MNSLEPDSDFKTARVYNLVERGAVVTQPEPEEVARLLQSWSSDDKRALGTVQHLARAALHRQLGEDVLAPAEQP